MCLKNRNHKSGFMLTEVLVAMAIIGIVLIPVLSQLDYLRFLSDYSKRLRIFFENKNLIIEQTFKARREKKQQAKFDGKTRAGRPFVYVRAPVKKATPPFKAFDDSQVKNLCRQEVSTVYRNRKEKVVNFLYKPLVSGS